MLSLFKPRTKAANEVKAILTKRLENSKQRQGRYGQGTEQWFRYQWQINAINDCIDAVDIKFNLNK